LPTRIYDGNRVAIIIYFIKFAENELVDIHIEVGVWQTILCEPTIVYNRIRTLALHHGDDVSDIQEN
jgi:hypothetical protein